LGTQFKARRLLVVVRVQVLAVGLCTQRVLVVLVVAVVVVQLMLKLQARQEWLQIFQVLQVAMALLRQAKQAVAVEVQVSSGQMRQVLLVAQVAQVMT
jgi:hypothetical protein